MSEKRPANRFLSFSEWGSKFISLSPVALAVGFIASTKLQKPATKDLTDYSVAPPFFVWDFVIPALESGARALSDMDPPHVAVLKDMARAHIPYTLDALSRANIAEILLEKSPMSTKEIAKIAKVDVETLYRLLRAVAALGYFRELPSMTESSELFDHCWENSPKSHTLTKSSPASIQYGV